MSDLPPPPRPGDPPPIEQPGGTPYNTGPQPAGVGIRFGAKVIDFFVLLIPNILIGIIFGGGFAAAGADFGIGVLIGSLLTTLIAYAYYVYLEMSRGMTVGKQLLNLRVVGPDGNNPTQDQALRRNAYILLGLISWIPILGWLVGLAQLGIVIAIAVTISSDSFNRGVHDNFAGGTAVVRTS